MDKKVFLHFQTVDPTLASLIKKFPIEDVTSRNPRYYFVSLCREIIGQQLSGRVADVLCDRFMKLFPKLKVTPHEVSVLSEETLRNTGMSWSKARFIKDLAQKVMIREVKLDHLHTMSDEDVVQELMKVKGIGPWTAEMFLMFSLGREDIFSHGDLGLRRAIQKLYHFKKEPTRKQIEKISRKWSPYRTYACRILWNSLEIKT